MVCQECGGKTEVTHNRSFPQYIRRRRVCKECGAVMTTYETLKPPGERYPMGRSHSMSKVKEEHKENNLLCKYNVGVVCQIPLKDRPCGKCGWRPSVEQKRKKQIEIERGILPPDPVEEPTKQEKLLGMDDAELAKIVRKMIQEGS